MIFSSVIFLFYFFPLVLIVYFLVRKELRNGVLLVASLFFYAWGEPRFVFVLLISIVLNYLVGTGIDKAPGLLYRKFFLTAGIGINLFILFFYKYVNFTINILNRVIRVFDEGGGIHQVSVLLPIGLSFFTFQGLSYIVDVYRGTVPAQKNPLYIALYISMFPQLIAGPIVRYEDIYKNFNQRISKLDDVVEGLQRFIIGLTKKVMIADILAQVVDKIFAMDTNQLTTSVAWIGAICYSFQIYFDFSGYSDMAIGMGRIFGFCFLENFNLPYISKSVTEFWRRWHISLSSWFRDYLYIPLGGNRKGNVYFNLIVVFICTGLWHGAAYTFLVWGLWHGAFMIMERVGKKRQFVPKIPKIVSWIYTMSVVLVGWVIFRSDSMSYAVNYLKIMAGHNEMYRFGLFTPIYYLDRQVIFTLTLAAVLSSGIQNRIADFLKNSSVEIGWSFIKIPVLSFLLLCNMSMIVNGNYSPFIYFRF